MRLAHLAHLQHRPWAILLPELTGFVEQVASIAALITAGASPYEKVSRAVNGERVMDIEIGRDGLATLPIAGVLLDKVPWFLHYFGVECTDLSEATSIVNELTDDDRCKGIVLDINSPGGTTNGTSELVTALTRFAAAGKSITGSARGMMCSAAYWIGCTASRLTATSTTIVGSIGTYVVFEDRSKANEAAGVEPVLIASGPLKGLGADDKVTPEMRAMWQGIINDLTSQFIASVADGRDMDTDEAKALATGGVWLGAQAKSLGLIDALAGEDAADDDDTKPTTTPEPPTTSDADPADDDKDPDKPEPGNNAVLTIKTLAALIASVATLPTAQADTAWITEQASAGADEPTIKAGLATRHTTALQASVTDLQSKLTASETAHTATKAELTKEKAKNTRLTSFSKGATNDPGPSDANDATKPSPLAYDDYMKLSAKEKARYMNAGGVMPEQAAK